MEQLIIVLFERIGMLLVVAFMLTRIPSFRYLLDRELGMKAIVYYSLIFGLFGIAAGQAGVVISGSEVTSHLWTFRLQDGEMLIGSTLVAVVIAGLLGGPVVGLGAGLIVALYLQLLGGQLVLAGSTANLLTGLLAGFTARFFSEERVIAPEKALFIGMFAPILHMCLLLIFSTHPQETIRLVNTVGLPLVITNSVAIAIFMAMIRVAFNEKEREAALETERALKIAEKALPHLRKGLNPQTAQEISVLLYDELKIAAVSLTNTKIVLAHVGLGADHHVHGELLQTNLSQNALSTGRIQMAHNQGQIQCSHGRCPFRAAIFVPIHQSGDVVGLIKLYFRRSQQIRAVEIALAQGLGTLISHQLDVIATEKMKTLVRDAELRNLQAQINPHFLFNTLHSIDALVRVNPPLARHLIVKLSYFMRSNLSMTSAQLIPLEKELNHLQAYLEIVKVRFADQFTVHCACDEGIENTVTPPFTLQPLVENSIKHGLKDMESKGRIDISLRREGSVVFVKIADNGVGFPSSILGRLGKEPIHYGDRNGTGIYNVNQRLLQLLGETAGLHFENGSRGGCAVSFRLPVSVQSEVHTVEN